MSEATKKRTGEGIAPPADLVEAVRELVATLGEGAAADKLGVSQAALTRFRGALPVRAGTIALVRQALASS